MRVQIFHGDLEIIAVDDVVTIKRHFPDGESTFLAAFQVIRND